MVFGILHVTAAGLRIVNQNLYPKTILKLPPLLGFYIVSGLIFTLQGR